jgi:hypothetical protein
MSPLYEHHINITFSHVVQTVLLCKVAVRVKWPSEWRSGKIDIRN